MSARVQMGLHDKGTNKELRILKQQLFKPNLAKLAVVYLYQRLARVGYGKAGSIYYDEKSGKNKRRKSNKRFRFNIININRNVLTDMHVDGSNAGSSAIATFGNFPKGQGGLWYGEEGGKIARPVAPLEEPAKYGKQKPVPVLLGCVGVGKDDIDPITHEFVYHQQQAAKKKVKEDDQVAEPNLKPGDMLWGNVYDPRHSCALFSGQVPHETMFWDRAAGYDRFCIVAFYKDMKYICPNKGFYEHQTEHGFDCSSASAGSLLKSGELKKLGSEALRRAKERLKDGSRIN